MKTAIICVGGGMRSAHTGGFLHTLATQLEITQPDMMIGSSGSAGSVAYYSAGQYESLPRIWEELVATPRFISLLRPWRIMNVDYIIDEVFKKLEPLDVAKLETSPIDWRISITECKTGRPRYVGKQDKLDVFEVLRASKAIPVWYGKRVTLEGRVYFDGDCGPTLEDHLKFVLESGARKILILTCAPHRSPKSVWLLRMYAKHLGGEMGEALVRDATTNATCLTAPNATIICANPSSFPAKLLTRDRATLKQTFDLGVKDALALSQELRTLFL